MTRQLFQLPLALSLLASTALADTAIPMQAPGGGDSFTLDCLINGRSERFSVSNGTLAEGTGTVSRLAEGVYAITRDGITYLIDPTGVQVDRGPDIGKWDCVDATVNTGVGAMPENPDLMARIVELQGLVANLEAALSAARGERQAAILSRDMAFAARDEAQAALSAAMAEQQETARLTAELQAAQAETAALRERMAQLQGLVEQADAQAEADQARIEALGARLNTALAEMAAAQAEQEAQRTALAAERDEALEGLAAATARIGELEAELAAQDGVGTDPDETDGPAESPEAAATDVEEPAAEAEEPATEDAAPDGAAFTVEGFDPDAALLALEASDLSPIAQAALAAAVEQARSNPAFVADVVTRLQNALGQ